MKVISAQHENGNPITQEEWENDYPQLTKIHNNALKTEPLWVFFGGIITIEDRNYQVV